MRNLWKRYISLLLCAVLLLTSTAALADGKKEEVVYAVLNGDGSVSGVYVVNILPGESGTDYGTYDRVQLLNTEGSVSQADGMITLQTDAERVYYQGDLSGAQLPWSFSLNYTLDGRSVSAEELAGSSGHVVICLSVRSAGEAAGSFAESHALQITMQLDTDRCSGITAENATQANVGKLRQLSWILLPGTEKDLVVETDADGFEMEAISINGIRMSLDVEVDVSLENETAGDSELTITEAVTRLDDGAAELADGTLKLKDGAQVAYDGAVTLADGAKDLKDGAQEAYDGAVTLADGAKDLKDGAQEAYDGAVTLADGAKDLKDGAQEAYDGAVTLANGAKDLKDGAQVAYDGAITLANGANDLKDGVQTAYDGAFTLTEGAQSLLDGAQALDDASATLTAGAGLILDAMLDQANTQLSAASSSLSRADVTVPTLTRENYTAEIAAMQTALLSRLDESLLVQADQLLESAVYAAAQEKVRPQVETAVRTKITAAVTASLIDQGMDPESPEGQQQIAALTEAQMNSGEVQALIEQQTAAMLETNSMQATMTAEINAGRMSRTYLAVVQTLMTQQGLPTDAYALLYGLRSQLDDAMTFYTGLLTYTDGVSTLTAGAERLRDGAAALSGSYDADAPEDATGLGKLLSGAIELSDGAAELAGTYLADDAENSTGLGKLLGGTVKLSDGAAELAGTFIAVDAENSTGLGKLLSGAGKLSDGAAELAGIYLADDAENSTGLGKLLSGAGELSDGAAELAGTYIADDAENSTGLGKLLSGAGELSDGAAELAGTYIADDEENSTGLGKLLNGAILLNDGAAELHDGTTDFKSAVDGLDDKVADRIREAIDEKTGRNVPDVSFVDERNNTGAVQFVITTRAIREEEPEAEEKPEQAAEETLWDRLAHLFDR